MGRVALPERSVLELREMRSAAVLFVLTSTSAWADSSMFATLDRQSGISTAGVEVSYVQLAQSDFDGERGEAHVELVDPGTGLGGYLRVPFAHYAGSGMYDASGSALGDVELGGVLRVRSRYDIDILLHAGLALPTAPNTGDNLPNEYMALARCQDLALALPDGTSVRLGVSPIWRAGNFVARADLGVDFNLSNQQLGGEGARSFDIGWIAHFDAGIGYAIEHFALMVELTSIRTDGNFPVSEMLPGTPFGRFVSAAFSVRFPLGRIAPYAALLVPLQGSFVHNRVGFGATTGVDVAVF